MPEDESDDEQHPFHLEGSSVIFDKPPSAKETKREAREREAHEFARNQVKLNRRTAWFNGLLVVATFSSVVIGLWQGSISQTAADAARDSVKIAGNTLQHTKDQEMAQAVIDKDTREKSQQSADRSAKLTQKSLQASIDNFRLDQRPWVYVSAWRLNAEPEEGKQVTITVQLANSGKTPALKSFVLSQFDINFNEPKAPDYSRGPIPSALGVIPPGTPKLTYSADSGIINHAVWYNYTYNLTKIYLFGRLNYLDSFGTRHSSTFCVNHVHGEPLEEFHFCLNGNDVDRNR